MSETDSTPGTVQRVGNEQEIRLRRHFDHTPAAVWAMLTEPALLPKWLAPGSVELRVGGRAQIDFPESGAVIESVVRECDPPRRLAYAWSSGNEPERPMQWVLEPANGGTRLRLTLRLPAEEDGAKAAAGWSAHLEMLAAALEGVPIRFPVDYFLQAREQFRRQSTEPTASGQDS